MNKLWVIRIKSFIVEIGTLVGVSVAVALLNLVGSEPFASLIISSVGPEFSTVVLFVIIGAAKHIANKYALKTTLGGHEEQEEVVLV